MRLIITEKPSMGRDVAAALGATKRAQGYIEGKQDIITWCIGHLVEPDLPEAYDEKFKQWRLADLPIVPEKFKYRVAEQTRDQYKVIKELLARNDVTSVVNAADAGREGELIFDLVYTLAKCKKPVERLWISSLTHDAILDGFKQLKPAAHYQGLRDSAYARQQADWLVGLNATRAQTLRSRRAGYEGVYSLGRVQTPTLAVIVERDIEIGNFKSVDYFEVIADFNTKAGDYRGLWFNSAGSRFDKRAAAQAIVDKVKDQPAIVEKVEKKFVKERAPLLYDLTSLQRAGNIRYSFSAARTLEIAQSLYEKKFISYPRTSSRHLSSSVASNLKGHIEATNFGPYQPFVAKILAKGRLKLSSRHVDDGKVTDHHAIIPTKERVDAAGLNNDEKRIYDLIVRRFLAAFFDDAEMERTTIITAVAGEKFVTRGTVILKPGWREVDPPGREKKSVDEDEAEAGELPAVKEQDPAKTINAEVLAKQTKPPQRFTEASLLAAMETAGKKIDEEELRLAMKDSGLGTPATRASIIETLLKREYITRDKKALLSTEKGRALIKMLPSPLLKSAELTGLWEKRLADMARGQYAKQAFTQEVTDMVRSLVEQIAGTEIEKNPDAATAITQARPEKALDCPNCRLAGRDGFLIERTSKNGKFVTCSVAREVCGYISDAPKNSNQRKALATRCPECNSAMRLRLPSEKGRPVVLLCTRYPDCKSSCKLDENGAVVKQQSVEYGPACVKCGARTIKRGPAKNGNYFYGCEKWKPGNAGCTAELVWINK